MVTELHFDFIIYLFFTNLSVKYQFEGSFVLFCTENFFFL